MSHSAFIAWRWIIACVVTITADFGHSEAGEPSFTVQFPQSEREQPQPVLKTAEQIHRLTREEAARAHRAEIRGVVTSVGADGVILLTHGGKINAILVGTNGVPWTRHENSLIRLRGCLFASWDANTHQVRVGEIRMFSPSVTVDEAAPDDVF